jgi:hypothetical protein
MSYEPPAGEVHNDTVCFNVIKSVIYISCNKGRSEFRKSVGSLWTTQQPKSAPLQIWTKYCAEVPRGALPHFHLTFTGEGGVRLGTGNFLRFSVLADNHCQLRFTTEQHPVLDGDCAWEGECGPRSSVTQSRYSGSDCGSLGYLQQARFTTVCEI